MVEGYKMTQKKLTKLFELASELYSEEQKKSGMIEPLPCCYAEKDGMLIMFSGFGVFSRRLKKAADIEFKGWPD